MRTFNLLVSTIKNTKGPIKKKKKKKKIESRIQKVELPILYHQPNF